jgi:hypothetical protein
MLTGRTIRVNQTDKSFLFLFFKKEILPFCTLRVTTDDQDKEPLLWLTKMRG